MDIGRQARRRILKSMLAAPVLAGLGTPIRAFAQDADALISSADQALDVFDFERVARATLPPAHFGYLATGVDGDAMVAVLHSRGIASLYLCSGMSGSGAGWRYSIGAMDAGHWPRPLRDPLQVFNSLNGSDESSQIEWGSICDDPTVLADKFL